MVMSNLHNLIAALHRQMDDAQDVAGRLRLNEPLARRTTYRIGGPADLLLVARTTAELCAWARLAHEHDVPILLLGMGSNVLVADAGVRGLTLINACRRFRLSAEGELVVESGAGFSRVGRAMARAGWQGLEWAAGIPGTVGGAVVGNAGAFGGCIADVLQRVTLLLPDGSVRTVAAAELGYDYRASALKRAASKSRWAGAIVLDATLALQPGDARELGDRMAQIRVARRARQPVGHCAGSVFKRTEGYPAGFLIDQAGLKGTRIGGAMVSTKHANFFMNVDGATADDVLALMELVRRTVWNTFAQRIEPEIELVGEWTHRSWPEGGASERPARQPWQHTVVSIGNGQDG
jgi:UDP-N-acetylmuramate dehydrogenase